MSAETPGPGGTHPESISRNAAFAFATQAVTATFTAGLTIFLVRYLGPADYGVFALAFGIGALLVLPADFGISQATARFVAERRAPEGAAASVLAQGLRLKIVPALVIGALLFGLAGPIADAYGIPDLIWPLRAMAIAVVAQTTLAFYGAAFAALGRISLNLRAVLGESVAETTASVALVLLGGGATGAAFGRAIGYAFGAALALVLVVRLLGRGALRGEGERTIEARRLLGYSSALFIVEGAFTLFGQIDTLVIGALLSTTAVGLFQAPWRLTTVTTYPGLALAAAIAPRLAREQEGAGPDLTAFTAGLRLLTLFQAAITVPLLVWAGPITDLVLGASYEESAEVLQWLAPYVFLAGFAPLVSNGVDYLGEARRRIPIAIATVALNIAIDIIFIPEIGIIAAAIGTSAAYVIYVPAHLWICRDAAGVRLRPLLPTLARSALAAAGMAAVLLVVGTSDLSALEWVGGGAGALAAFLGLLVLSGELGRDELRRGAELARAAVGSGGSGGR